MSEEPTVERLTRIYVKMREKRRELDRQSAELKEKQDLVASELLEICKAQGATTIRTAHGTVSKRVTKN